jgi:DNA-binding response OmpR family regulator
MHVLVVEDEICLAESLVNGFRKNNYTVNYTDNVDDGLYLAMMGVFDIIVLDTSTHKTDGITILKNIRSNGLTAPVILLSSKGEISDKVSGLDSGADDYLVKPFSVEELLARVRALCRRNNSITLDDTLRFGDIILNTSNLKLSTDKGEIQLTCLEFKLLELLMLRKCMITSKERIIDKIWGIDSEAQANHVEVYISFLRKKLSMIKSNVVINTVRGVGYELKYTTKS